MTNKVDRLLERSDLTLAERIWLFIWTTFTAATMIYNIITVGNPWG